MGHRHLTDAAYREALEQTLDGVLFTIPDGTILHANPAACAMLGRTEEELRGLGRQGITDLEDIRWQRALEERRNRGRVRSVAPFLRADGTVFLAEMSSSIFSQPDGSERSVVIMRDVTSQVRLQQRLQASNEITHSILAGEPTEDVLTRVADAARRLLDATDAAVVTPSAQAGTVVVRVAVGPGMTEFIGRSYSGSLAAQTMETGRSLVLDDLTTAAISEDGRSLGLGPAIVVPIVSEGRAFGNLLVATETGSRPFNAEDLMIAEDFAQAAGVALALGEARSELERHHEETAEQLRHALESRVAIEQAKGIISASRGISIDEAFQRLRSHARAHSAKLHDVASAVCRRELLP